MNAMTRPPMKATNPIPKPAVSTKTGLKPVADQMPKVIATPETAAAIMAIM